MFGSIGAQEPDRLLIDRITLRDQLLDDPRHLAGIVEDECVGHQMVVFDDLGLLMAQVGRPGAGRRRDVPRYAGERELMECRGPIAYVTFTGKPPKRRICTF